MVLRPGGQVAKRLFHGTREIREIRSGNGDLVWQPETIYSWDGAAHESASSARRAGKLIGENLVLYPSFELGTDGAMPTGWAAARITAEKGSTRVLHGTRSVKLTGQVGQSSRYFLPGYLNKPSNDPVVRFWFYADVPTPVFIRVWAYSSAGVGSSESFTGPETTIPAGVWTRVTLYPTFTDATTLVRPSVFFMDYSTEPVVWVDSALMARRSYDLGHYFDGSTPDILAQ